MVAGKPPHLTIVLLLSITAAAALGGSGPADEIVLDHDEIQALCDQHTKRCDAVDPSLLGMRRVPAVLLAGFTAPPLTTSEGDGTGASIGKAATGDARVHWNGHGPQQAKTLVYANGSAHADVHVSDEGDLTVSPGFETDLAAKLFAKPGSGEPLQHEKSARPSAEHNLSTRDEAREPHEPAIPCQDPRGCPDLIVDRQRLLTEVFLSTENVSPDDCNVAEGSTQPGTRKLLRFTFASPNIGDGDLIVGFPPDHPNWFEWALCHGHYHFQEYADYRLWTVQGYVQWQVARAQNPDATPEDILTENPELLDEFVAGHKQGFCVIDIDWWHPFAGQKYLHCFDQGISSGWSDVYDLFLDGQFIDVTDVPFGAYVLEAEVNPERFYEEEDYSNNSAAVLVTLGSPSTPPVHVPPELPPEVQ